MKDKKKIDKQELSKQEISDLYYSESAFDRFAKARDLALKKSIDEDSIDDNIKKLSEL